MYRPVSDAVTLLHWCRALVLCVWRFGTWRVA